VQSAGRKQALHKPKVEAFFDWIDRDAIPASADHNRSEGERSWLVPQPFRAYLPTATEVIDIPTSLQYSNAMSPFSRR
jgi:hypothetical protein